MNSVFFLKKRPIQEIYRIGFQYCRMTGAFFLIFFAAVLAFMLSAFCGGGAGMILMPLLGIFLPAVQIPAALSIGTFTSSAARLAVFYRNINFRIVRCFVPAAIPAVLLGARLLRFINPLYLGMIMGIFLVSNIPFLLKKAAPAPVRKEPSAIALAGIGMAAGFLSGLTGAVGLLFNRFYFRYGLSKEEIVATRAANEIILHLIKLALYLSFGMLDGKALTTGLIVAAAGLLSSRALKSAIRLISDGQFRRIGYAAMVASGCWMLLQSGHYLLFSPNEPASGQPFSRNGSNIHNKLQWQRSAIALEFSWDEGPEYERTIHLASLPAEKQQYVYEHACKADEIIIEVVYQWKGRSYEAYYLKQGRLERKIEFP